MRGKFNRTIVAANSGAVVPYAMVDVFDQATGDRVDIYSSQTGGTPISNPFESTSLGFVSFFLDAGQYRFVARSAGGAFISEITHEVVVDPSIASGIYEVIEKTGTDENIDYKGISLRYLQMTNSSAKTLTFRPFSSFEIGVGEVFNIRNSGAGLLTVIAGSGVTINPPTSGVLTIEQNGSAAVICIAEDEYDMIGVAARDDLIETWAGISSVTPTAAGQLFTLKQHTSSGLGGGTLMAFVGSVTDDGGTQKNCLGGFYLKRINHTDATISMFGAIGDGVTDDTVSVQKAIDFCVPQPASIPAKKLIVDGRCLITSSLYIDRYVDATVNLFEVEGNGELSGFVQNTGFTLFDSRAAYGAAAGLYAKTPVTEFTVFKNIVFENSIGSASGFIFNEKFLRLAFDGCRFRGIRGGTGTDYWQSIKFYNCHFRGNNGVFLQNRDGYDIRAIDCEFESAGLGFNFTGVLRGSSVEAGLCQNTTVPIMEVSTGNGVTVEGMYFENNTGANYIKFGSGTSDGVNVVNNTFLLSASQEADVNYWPVAFGAAKHGSLIGNYSSGNIADASLTAQFAISHNGNAVPVNRLVISDLPIITPNSAGTQAAATKIRTKCAICQAGALNSSVILPQITASQEIDVIIVSNQGADTIRVFPFSGERVFGLAYNAATTIASGASKHFMNSFSNDYWIEY